MTEQEKKNLQNEVIKSSIEGLALAMELSSVESSHRAWYDLPDDEELSDYHKQAIEEKKQEIRAKIELLEKA